MTDAEIEKVALQSGFKLKEQPDGSMALNPYVFEFAREMYRHGWAARKQLDFHLMYNSGPRPMREAMKPEVHDDIADFSLADAEKLLAMLEDRKKKHNQE